MLESFDILVNGGGHAGADHGSGDIDPPVGLRCGHAWKTLASNPTPVLTNV